MNSRRCERQNSGPLEIRVLDTVSRGLPVGQIARGTYQVEAEHEGVVKRQTVAIRAGKHERAVFVWAPSEETRPMRNDPLARVN